MSKAFIKFYKKKIDSRNGNTSDKELIDISSDDDSDKRCMESVKKPREVEEPMKKAISPPKEIVTQSAAPLPSEPENETPGTVRLPKIFTRKDKTAEDEIRRIWKEFFFLVLIMNFLTVCCIAKD